TPAVARPIVGDDDLLIDRSEIDGTYTLDDLADRLLFVVDGDDYRKLHRYHAAEWSASAACSRRKRQCTPRASSVSRSDWSSSSHGRRTRGAGRDSTTTTSSRSPSHRGSRFRPWTCRGATPTSR